MSLAGRFVRWNTTLSRSFDRLLPFLKDKGNLGSFHLRQLFAEAHDVVDIGGGKKPFVDAFNVEVGERRYAGVDIDPDELKSAPAGTYTETHVIDLLDPPQALDGQFDLAICRHTLEHVTDNEIAIGSLIALLRPGGRCFVKLPCRKAVFARLNTILPNELKRRAMHLVFPHKSGDGFPAFYDKCTPSEIRALLEASGMNVLAETRSYWSSYFSFFLPVHIIWRLLTIAQYTTDKDYCEAFVIVFEKPQEK